MIPKKSQVMAHVQRGRYKEALALCRNWNLPVTEEESSILRRGYECMTYPRFYEQLGYVPEEQIRESVRILLRIYGESDGEIQNVSIDS